MASMLLIGLTEYLFTPPPVGKWRTVINMSVCIRDLRSFEIRFEFESDGPIRKFSNWIGRACPSLVVSLNLHINLHTQLPCPASSTTWQNNFARTAEIIENKFAKLNIDAANIFLTTHNSRNVAQLMR